MIACAASNPKLSRGRKSECVSPTTVWGRRKGVTLGGIGQPSVVLGLVSIMSIFNGAKHRVLVLNYVEQKQNNALFENGGKVGF